MATEVKNDARLDLRLPSELKEAIEQAAAYQGQSVRDFAVAALARAARAVIEQQTVTTVSRRDWERLAQLLDDVDAKPNAALVAAAQRYKEQLGER